MSDLNSRCAILLIVSGEAIAQSPQVLQTGEVAPTAFETFVSDPAVVVEQEQPLGRFQGLETAIAISALEAEDRVHPGLSTRGVRVDLATNAWRTSVFLDEDQFSELSRDLRSIADHQNEFENAPEPEQLYGWRGRGTGACWMPREPQRILCPNYLIQQGFQSFSINVYGSDQSFPFATDELANVASAFEAAKNIFESDDLYGSIDEPERLEQTPAASSAPEPSGEDPVRRTPSRPVPASSESITETRATGTHGWAMILTGSLFAIVGLLVIRSLVNRARK